MISNERKQRGSAHAATREGQLSKGQKQARKQMAIKILTLAKAGNAWSESTQQSN